MNPISKLQYPRSTNFINRNLFTEKETRNNKNSDPENVPGEIEWIKKQN